MEIKKKVNKTYFWGIRLVSILSGAAFAWIVYSIPPEQGILWKIAFFSSLFLFLSGLSVLILNRLRKKRDLSDQEIADNLWMSFHQGILLAFLAVLLLIMQSFRMLLWWDGLLVTAGVLLVELYYLTNRK